NTRNIFYSYMAINEWKIWQNLGIIKPKKEFINIDKSTDIILSFLKETEPALKSVARLYSQLKSLRKMELKLKKEKAGKNSLRNNIQKQVKKYDQILKAYELLELDTDVNGERVKKIADEIESKARRLKADKELLKKMATSDHWTFDW
ncbi:hypothetical protein KY342_04540, partial [Candidatus Woesearchaeota archaeon]|nr:hypothetical protein [Candidatus Woesearchaeota archaeon]